MGTASNTLLWILAGLLLTVGGTGHALASTGGCPRTPVEIRSGTVSLSPDGSVASAGPEAPIDLPDDWRRSRPGVGGFAWYRLPLRAEAGSDDRCAVSLPDLNMNARVYVNGEWIGEGGRMAEPVAHNFNRPLYFSFPSSLLRGKDDRIDVLLYAYPHHFGRLGPIRVGPNDALADHYGWAYFRQITLAQIGTALAAITALFALAIWAGSGFESVYGFFFLSTAAWAINSLNYWVRDIPLPHWTWDRLMNGALDQFAVFLAFFFHRVVEVHRPRIERGLAVFSVVAAVAAVATPRPWLAPVWMVTHAGITAIGAYVTVLSWTHRHRLVPVEARIYVGAWATQLFFSLNDLGIQLGFWRGLGYMLPFTVSCMMVAFGSTLALRVARALGEERITSEQLEHRVREREGELAAHFERMTRLERAEVLRSERQRLMREMHDGLGSQLVSSLALAESGNFTSDQIVTTLRDGIEELRLVILALDPELGDVSALLAGLRDRLEPVLERRGIAFRWGVTDVPSPSGWGPEQLLSLLRIVQEAISNSVQHADPKTIEVSTAVRDGSVRVTVRDDGRGFSEPLRRGRGLASMRRRASDLACELRIESGENGTTVEVRLPLTP